MQSSTAAAPCWCQSKLMSSDVGVSLCFRAHVGVTIDAVPQLLSTTIKVPSMQESSTRTQLSFTQQPNFAIGPRAVNSYCYQGLLFQSLMLSNTAIESLLMWKLIQKQCHASINHYQITLLSQSQLLSSVCCQLLQLLPADVELYPPFCFYHNFCCG